MALVQDPVCGMAIDPQTFSLQSIHAQTTYYFCSPECRARFEQNPESFIRAEPAQAAGDGRRAERHEPPWTTKGRVTSPKFGSAGSGGAEYELLPEAHEGKSRKH